MRGSGGWRRRGCRAAAGLPGGAGGGGTGGSASIGKSEQRRRSIGAAPHTVTPAKFLMISFISVISIAAFL